MVGPTPPNELSFRTNKNTEYVCVTCSGALSNMERQTLTFLFSMGLITVISFTWFAGGFGAIF